MSAENNQQGDFFHRGMAEIRGETREHGWVREHPEPATNQRLDQARIYVNEREREFTEYKSGRIDARCVEQLAKHLELLDRGMYRSAEWVSVTPIERTPKEFQDLVRGAQDRGLNFKYVTPERHVIKEAIEKGKQQVAGQQLELPGVGDKAREAQAQDLQKARDRQVALSKAREAKERFQAVQRFKDASARGRVEAPAIVHAERVRRAELRSEHVKARETPETERIRAGRAAAEKAVREFQDRLRDEPGSSADNAAAKTATPKRESPEAARARVEQEAREQVLRDFPFPAPQQPPERETLEIGERSIPELDQAASVAREAADKAQAAEREEADRAREEARERAKALEQHQLHGLSPEVRNLLALGQAQPPAAAVETKPGYAPQVQGLGRNAQGISRGPERGR
ncbi:hypothetical protein AB0M22_07960 [Nocardia sp. NPDC051756]|uniref:hypothetical protein n=1 Tax=Nocardia sp. NPDC051756 TaxID=3154751 RepID=UPI00342E957B